MKTGAVIVAAGHKIVKSSFQPMLPIGDSTVIRRIIITMKQAGIDPVVVVTGRQGDELEKHMAGLQVICLRNDRYEDTQMYDSICMGLNYIEDLCDRVLTLPAKYPLLLKNTIELLLEEEAEAVCPVYQGRRGHPVLIACSLIQELLAFKGDGGLRGVLRQEEIRERVREVPVEDEGIIFSVETDEECAAGRLADRRIDIHPHIEIRLERNDSFFGPSMAQFLSLIDHTGSMQTACRQMHMSYTKGWKLLKEAEKQMGYPLLDTRSGGADGGSSRLTPKTKDFLSRYLRMEEELTRQGRRLFEQYFIEGERK